MITIASTEEWFEAMKIVEAIEFYNGRWNVPKEDKISAETISEIQDAIDDFEYDEGS